MPVARALRRLEEALADPDFEAFTELVLKAVGYERDGGGEAPARRRARLAAEAALAAAEEELEGDESGEDDGGGRSGNFLTVYPILTRQRRH